MHELIWTENDIADLHDDFFINEENDFWEFIGEDIPTAFYLGLHFDKWFKELKDPNKQYLYSKGARHCNDDLAEHQDQVSFWSERFANESKSEEVDMIELSEYVLNHMIFQLEDKELIVNLAFCLGRSTGKILFKNDLQEDKQSDSSN